MDYSLPMSLIYHVNNCSNLLMKYNKKYDIEIWNIRVKLTKDEYVKLHDYLGEYNKFLQKNGFQIMIEKQQIFQLRIMDDNFKSYYFEIPDFIISVIQNPRNIIPNCLINCDSDNTSGMIHVNTPPDYLEMFPWITQCFRYYRFEPFGHAIYYGDLYIGYISIYSYNKS